MCTYLATLTGRQDQGSSAATAAAGAGDAAAAVPPAPRGAVQLPPRALRGRAGKKSQRSSHVYFTNLYIQGGSGSHGQGWVDLDLEVAPAGGPLR